ncbi:hypothetical protein AJ79_09501 [Helicocarpus griseus UAMH5409]|uniref:Uncharacterized protein n=1 Tax=Helicocarpus griseus UAMH5409 TaxID=1447875 RepID=A0A2B7WJB3_9EURO|nr:hypothetical protein AJ79_09501 [Helicocarpus griseus UAMH5409]
MDAVVQETPLHVVILPADYGRRCCWMVEIVGSAATSKFTVGDRVVGLAIGAAIKKAEQGGFQE